MVLIWNLYRTASFSKPECEIWIYTKDYMEGDGMFCKKYPKLGDRQRREATDLLVKRLKASFLYLWNLG